MASPRRSISPWSYAAWAFGGILVLAIILSLGATVWRMDKTYNLVDSDIASPEDFQEMIDASIRWARIGLFTGIPAAALYLLSLIMHHRSKARHGQHRHHRTGERTSQPDQSSFNRPHEPSRDGDQDQDEWG